MRTIHKYELKPLNISNLVDPVMIPKGAKYLYVESQHNKIFLWAEIDTESEPVEHMFAVFGTGYDIPVDTVVKRTHIGSLMMYDGNLVMHVYSIL